MSGHGDTEKNSREELYLGIRRGRDDGSCPASAVGACNAVVVAVPAIARLDVERGAVVVDTGLGIVAVVVVVDVGVVAGVVVVLVDVVDAPDHAAAVVVVVVGVVVVVVHVAGVVAARVVVVDAVVADEDVDCGANGADKASPIRSVAATRHQPQPPTCLAYAPTPRTAVNRSSVYILLSFQSQSVMSDDKFRLAIFHSRPDNPCPSCLRSVVLG